MVRRSRATGCCWSRSRRQRFSMSRSIRSMLWVMWTASFGLPAVGGGQGGGDQVDGVLGGGGHVDHSRAQLLKLGVKGFTHGVVPPCE